MFETQNVAAPVLPDNRTSEKCPWEIEPGVPYPAFVKWRSLHYVEQGARWAKAPQANAKSEIRNNPARAADLWQQFLEYTNRAADNALAAKAAGIAPSLPSCLDEDLTAVPSGEEVMQKLSSLTSNPLPLPAALAASAPVPLSAAPQAPQSPQMVETEDNGDIRQRHRVVKAEDYEVERGEIPDSLKQRMQNLTSRKGMPKPARLRDSGFNAAEVERQLKEERGL